MKLNQNNLRLKQSIILISIIDGESGKIMEEYRKDIGDIDPFSLKRLLQNVCNGILKRYRRDMRTCTIHNCLNSPLGSLNQPGR